MTDAHDVPTHRPEAELTVEGGHTQQFTHRPTQPTGRQPQGRPRQVPEGPLELLKHRDDGAGLAGVTVQDAANHLVVNR